MRRREFLQSIPVGASLLAQGGAAAAAGQTRVEPFNYEGVRLRESRWRQQVETAREYYLNLSDDDILHGFRQASGLAAPGKAMPGDLCAMFLTADTDWRELGIIEWRVR